MQGQSKLYTVWLDMIRGLAALVVFLGHSKSVFIASSTAITSKADLAAKADDLSGKATFSHAAVIVFFVLSGYLVGGGAVRSLRNKRWSASNYAIARLSRLWTVLIPILLLGYGLDHLGVSLSQPGSIYQGPAGQGIVSTGLLDAMSIGNLFLNLFFLQKIITEPFGTNGPLWTLSYEFWFYVAFPFLMFSLHPATRISTRLASVFSLMCISLFVGTSISIYFLIWLLGVLIEISPKTLKNRSAYLSTLISAPIFVLIVVALVKIKLPLIMTDMIEACFFAVLCYFVVQLQVPTKDNLVSHTAKGLSAVSYTLYLAHVPILVFISGMLMPQWQPWPLNLVGLIKFGLVTSTVFLACIALYWLFERRTPEVRTLMTKAFERMKRT